MSNEERTSDNPRTAEPGEAVSGFPKPSTEDPRDNSQDPEPHHSLNNPVGEPDPTEWPDPYDKREDPKAPGDGQHATHTPTASRSTSEPHPSQDPEAEPTHAPEEDRLDD
jgi:hypothetical protein